MQFGTSGIAEDDFRETCFVISHDSVGLSLDMFLSMDFAVRLTSVGTEGGSRDDSLKIGDTAPETVDAPVETGPTYVANNDSMTVSNLEAFSAEGWPDPLDTFALSVIENDLVDELDYEGRCSQPMGKSSQTLSLWMAPTADRCVSTPMSPSISQPTAISPISPGSIPPRRPLPAG